MPPKGKPVATGKKPAGGAAKPASKPGAKPAVVKKAPAGKKADPKAAAAKKSETKPAVKKWTKEDEAARKIQTLARGFLSRKTIEKMRKEKEEYEILMDKLEQEACIAIAQQHQREAEEQARKEMEERKRKAEERKRIKRMLEASFDGEIDEINAILKEVRELDDKSNVGHDLVGEAKRMRHIMNMVECEDAHGNTPLSEASSGGHVETVKYLIELGADPNSTGQFKRTPLYRAAFAGHIDCCEMLLQNGADPRIYAEDSQTPESVASVDAIKELFAGWDASLTDQLLTKIESAKEKRREQEKARRAAEMSELDRQLADAQKEYEAHQKILNSIYCELNKRIAEHDTAPAMGFQKPEITLQAIQDAEGQLEVAKIDFEASKEKIRKLKLLQQEHKKEEIVIGASMPPKVTKSGAKKTSPAGKAKAPTPAKKPAAAQLADSTSQPATASEGIELPGQAISIKQLPDILFRDVGNKLKESGKWPMIIDTTTQAATYLRYQDTNYLNALAPKDMQTETIRLALIGSLRYGKPIVIDMMEVDMYQTVSDRLDELMPGLMEKIIDKSIMEEENYMKLVKPEDGEQYSKQNFSPMRLENFKLVIVTKNIFPSESLLNKMYVIRIHVPE